MSQGMVLCEPQKQEIREDKVFNTLVRWFFSLSGFYPILGKGRKMYKEDADIVVNFFTTRDLYKNVSNTRIEDAIRSIRVQESGKNLIRFLFFNIFGQAGTVGLVPNNTVYLSGKKTNLKVRSERLPLLIHEVGLILDQRLKYGWFQWIGIYIFWMARFRIGINHPLEIPHYKNGREARELLEKR